MTVRDKLSPDDEAIFWDDIAALDWRFEGDDEAVVKPLIARLGSRSPDRIADFFELLSRALHALDTPAQYDTLGEMSGDGFLYWRLCVVANGYDQFAETVKNPGSFPPDLWFEELLYVADRAHRMATGKEFDRFSTVGYESFSARLWNVRELR